MNLSEKGDIKVSAGVSGAGDGDGTDKENAFSLQAGYSPVKHLGIQGSLFRLERKGSNENEETTRGKGHIASGAIGGYYFLDFPLHTRKRIKRHAHLNIEEGFLFDLYAGYGAGSVYNQYAAGSTSDFNFHKLYLQGGIHVQGRRIGFDYVFKAVHLDFDNGFVNGKIETENYQEIQKISQNNPFFFVENSFRLTYGIKQCRFFFTTSVIGNTREKIGFDFIDSSVHFGLLLDIDEIFRKRR